MGSVVDILGLTAVAARRVRLDLIVYDDTPYSRPTAIYPGCTNSVWMEVQLSGGPCGAKESAFLGVCRLRCMRGNLVPALTPTTTVYLTIYIHLYTIIFIIHSSYSAITASPTYAGAAVNYPKSDRRHTYRSPGLLAIR